LALAVDDIDIVCLTDRPSGVAAIAAASAAAGPHQSTQPRRLDERRRLTSTTQPTSTGVTNAAAPPLPTGILQC